jgi:signal transduction histidine kinase
MSERTVELSAVVGAAVQALRPLAEARGIRLTAAFENAVATCDPQALENLMRRLVARAVQLTAVGGEVHVSVAQIDESAHLSVTDTGSSPPTPEEVADARKLVEHLGGEVEAYGDEGGGGSTLGVLLPLKR